MLLFWFLGTLVVLITNCSGSPTTNSLPSSPPSPPSSSSSSPPPPMISDNPESIPKLNEPTALKVPENISSDDQSQFSKKLAYANELIQKSLQNESKLDQKVILILADGVRYDYLNQPNLTGFEQILRQGVKAEYVQPIFPSNSYPNWYTIVTGLYAESHGMVQNFMYDEKRKDTFLMTPHPNASHIHWWNESEPIWVTAERNGIKTGLYWWDGCEVPIRNVLPTSCVEYQSYWSTPNPKKDTIAQLREILDEFKANELGFALVYYEAIDSIGHAWGPDSPELHDGMKDLDEIMKSLIKDIDIRNLTEKVSVLVVSDHGMLKVRGVKGVKLIDIDKIVDEKDVDKMFDRGSMAALYPKGNKKDKILSDLQNANVEGLHFYAREEMPLKYHYRYNDKIGPIILFVDKGYFLRGFKTSGKTIPVWDMIYTGHHGYDPYSVEEMRAFMYAFGPMFKQNFTSKPLMMTDHYNLVCHLLGISANPNNGSWSRVQDMLASKSESTSITLNETNFLNTLEQSSSSALATTSAFILFTIFYANLAWHRLIGI